MTVRLNMRRRILLVIVAVATVVALAGISASFWLKSPQQLAAEAAAPPFTDLTASVEKRLLRDTVVLRGDVVAGSTFELTPTLRETGRPVVTAVRVKPGDKIDAGTVLLEVAGRPLFALPGAVPAFRDLRPGLQGKDVAQLQEALRRLGHRTSDANGVFGAGTKRAVSEFYEDLGYEFPTTGESDEAALVAARAHVKAAERALDQAKNAASMATPSAEALQSVEYAEEELAAARESLSELVRRTGPMVPLSEFAFLPTFPARVDSLNARVGADVTAPLITVSSGPAQVRALVNPGIRGLLKTGMSVEIVADSLGITVNGAIASIGDTQTGQEPGFPMVVVPSGSVDERLIGENVRLTVEAASSDGEVLVVPVSALYAGADGRTALVRLLPNRGRERVLVTAGVSGDGFVAVEPVEPGTLTAGDQVLIGRA